MNIEHPEVEAASRFGYPCPEAHRPVCPYCGEESYELYFSTQIGQIVGCEACVKLKDAFELEEMGVC